MLTLLLLNAALAAEIPAGDGIDDALAIQVGPAGLDEVGGLVPALLPADALVIEDIADSVGAPAICVGGSYEFSNLNADLVINDVQITPLNGELELFIDLTIGLNDATDEFTLLIDALCLIDENCSGWIDPFDLTVTAPLTFEVVGAPGSRTLDATVGELDIWHDLDGSKLQTDCLLNDIEDVLNLFGMSIFDLVVNLFTDQLTELIEPTLDEALAQTNIAGDLDLLGALLTYRLEPSGVIHSTQGLQISMASQFDAPQAECIVDDDPGSSYATLSAIPDPMDNQPGSHAAIHASTDMVNQALYAAWRGGGLCMALGGEDAGLDLGGLALDTSLLGLIGGPGYDELFPEAKPIEIALRPHMAPLAAADGPNDLDLQLDELELIFLGELDGRMARALGVNVSADIGANVPFDDTTGEIGVELVVDSDAIAASLAGDPMVPGIADKVRDDFPAVMATLLDSMLPSLLGDTLAFALPTFEGLGLLSLDIEASGTGEDWLGAYATLGQAPYADPYAGGCGCDGGSTSTTGDCGGCSTVAAPRLAPVAWLLALVFARRRA